MSRKANTGEVVVVVSMTPPRECSPNARVHYRRKAMAARLFREVARWSTHEAIAGDPMKIEGLLRARRIAYRLIITWEKGRRGILDEDNIIASCKSALDGVADAVGVNDRVFTVRGVEVDRRGRPGTMTMIMWPLGGDVDD